MSEVREGDSPLATELFIQFSDNQEKARAASEERSSKREKRWFIMTMCSLVAVVSMGISVLIFFGQFDFETTEEYHVDNTGVYNMVNSETGDIISADIDPEILDIILNNPEKVEQLKD